MASQASGRVADGALFQRSCDPCSRLSEPAHLSDVALQPLAPLGELVSGSGSDNDPRSCSVVDKQAFWGGRAGRSPSPLLLDVHGVAPLQEAYADDRSERGLGVDMMKLFEMGPTAKLGPCPDPGAFHHRRAGRSPSPLLLDVWDARDGAQVKEAYADDRSECCLGGGMMELFEMRLKTKLGPYPDPKAGNEHTLKEDDVSSPAPHVLSPAATAPKGAAILGSRKRVRSQGAFQGAAQGAFQGAVQGPPTKKSAAASKIVGKQHANTCKSHLQALCKTPAAVLRCYHEQPEALLPLDIAFPNTPPKSVGGITVRARSVTIPKDIPINDKIAWCIHRLFPERFCPVHKNSVKRMHVIWQRLRLMQVMDENCARFMANVERAHLSSFTTDFAKKRLHKQYGIWKRMGLIEEDNKTITLRSDRRLALPPQILESKDSPLIENNVGVDDIYVTIPSSAKVTDLFTECIQVLVQAIFYKANCTDAQQLKAARRKLELLLMLPDAPSILSLLDRRQSDNTKISPVSWPPLSVQQAKLGGVVTDLEKAWVDHRISRGQIAIDYHTRTCRLRRY